MRPVWITHYVWDNPALAREWSQRRGAGRGREPLRWAGLAALLLGYAVALHWLSAPGRSPWEARAFLLGASLLYLLLVTVAVPGPAAGAVGLERERQTWQALLLTALQPSQLVAAKFLVALWPAARALALLAPLLLAGLHAARLGPEHAAAMGLVLLAAPTAVSAVSLWLSGRCRRTLTAAVLAYLLTGVLFWGTLAWAPSLYLRGENPWWYASPAWQVALLCLAEPSRSPLALPLLPEWAWFLLGCAAVSALALALLTRRIAAVERDA